MYFWSQTAAKYISLTYRSWKGNQCVKKYLLQNRCICTADLWEVEGGYKPAVLMALDFPRELLFCLQLAFLWQQFLFLTKVLRQNRVQTKIISCKDCLYVAIEEKHPGVMFIFLNCPSSGAINYWKSCFNVENYFLMVSLLFILCFGLSKSSELVLWRAPESDPRNFSSISVSK